MKGLDVERLVGGLLSRLIDVCSGLLSCALGRGDIGFGQSRRPTSCGMKVTVVGALNLIVT